MSKYKYYNKHLASLIIVITLLVTVVLLMLTYSVSANASTKGEWQVLCTVSHYKADDHIVFPGKAGESHMHSFYGNTTTNANSTTESLMASKSNCGREMQYTDRSAYWVPSIYEKQADGTKKLVKSNNQLLFAYYSRAGGATGPKVKPFPNGLRMIAGNHMATSPQPESVIYWACGGGGGGPRSGKIPTCNTPGQPIHASIVFPNCWDGKNLDSVDHKSHMAYSSSSGECPSSHPVSLPVLSFNLDYEGIKGGPNYTLAHGMDYGMHADFFAAWDVRAQNALVSECLNTPRPCIDITRDGDTLFKPSSNQNPIPRIDLTKFSADAQTTGVLPASSVSNTNTGSGNDVDVNNPDSNNEQQTGLINSNSDGDNGVTTSSSDKTDTKATTLPNTGTVGIIGIVLSTTILGYLFYLYRFTLINYVKIILFSSK